MSATSSEVPAAQSFSMVLLQLPFVACVTVHVALVALFQTPVSHANVAEPERQVAWSLTLTLSPELVVRTLAEQLSHVSVFPGQDGFFFWQWAVEPPHLPAQSHIQWVSVLVAFVSDPFTHSLISVPHSPFSGVLPVQDCVSRGAGLVDSGHAVLPHWQRTSRVRN